MGDDMVRNLVSEWGQMAGLGLSHQAAGGGGIEDLKVKALAKGENAGETGINPGVARSYEHMKYLMIGRLAAGLLILASGLQAQKARADGKTIPSKEELKAQLTPMQYEVTQNNGTEPPFQNAYWNNKKAGIYVDIVSGEPLFSSKDKFDSGTGWPSFTKPLVRANVVEVRKNGSIDVRSKAANSHLGDKFHDGPSPTGIRYCLDSAALRFIPVADLAKDGYGKFASDFAATGAKRDSK